ncbi:hypothetical protein BpHYR1_006680 [Brachionus plicatilis]|uniref:Uncharacterized protein n=1 Tax=Brachionus plicatilis TaxID=10195 RepID=A0A3M7QQ53_BRAPC|nr:hypothetical protein BpHYR1_006680 [Brachionus plicatilis]
MVINLIDLVNGTDTMKKANFISAEEQDKDEAIKWIKQLIFSNENVKPTITKFETNFHKKLYDVYDDLSIENNILFLHKKSHDDTILKLLVLPSYLVDKTIEKVHSVYGLSKD